jgi:hypothetical protein
MGFNPKPNYPQTSLLNSAWTDKFFRVSVLENMGQKMRILVTGSKGFIGKELCTMLQSHHYEVFEDDKTMYPLNSDLGNLKNFAVNPLNDPRFNQKIDHKNGEKNLEENPSFIQY